MTFFNVYEDTTRAEAYAEMEFPGTYYLAYRDLPEIIATHIQGPEALDFGCGAGRSTRFLKNLGFDTIGVDISADMIKIARSKDANGDYRLIDDGDLDSLNDNSLDLVQAIFTFDNVPTTEKKEKILMAMKRVVKPEGFLLILVSDPLIYTHEWASFSTKDFPENKLAKSGDRVKIIQTDIADKRPVEDVIWSHEAYLKIFEHTGFQWVKTYKPLGKADEPFQWVNETKIAPWVIYILKKK